MNSAIVFFVVNKVVHGSLEQDRGDNSENTSRDFQQLFWAWSSPAWAASPSSVSYRKQEHLDPPWPPGGQSPWPAGPPNSEPETEPRMLGRSQTHVPVRFQHNPESFPVNQQEYKDILNHFGTDHITDDFNSSVFNLSTHSKWGEKKTSCVYHIYSTIKHEHVKQVYIVFTGLQPEEDEFLFKVTEQFKFNWYIILQTKNCTEKKFKWALKS